MPVRGTRRQLCLQSVLDGVLNGGQEQTYHPVLNAGATAGRDPIWQGGREWQQDVPSDVIDAQSGPESEGDSLASASA